MLTQNGAGKVVREGINLLTLCKAHLRGYDTLLQGQSQFLFLWSVE